MQINNTNRLQTKAQSFGLGIYGTKGLKSLKQFYYDSNISPEIVDKFFDKLFDKGSNDISLYIRNVKKDDGAFLPRVKYWIAGEVPTTGGNKHYVRVNGLTGASMTDFNEQLDKDLVTLSVKAENLDAKAKEPQKISKGSFIKRFFAKFLK